MGIPREYGTRAYRAIECTLLPTAYVICGAYLVCAENRDAREGRAGGTRARAHVSSVHVLAGVRRRVRSGWFVFVLGGGGWCPPRERRGACWRSRTAAAAILRAPPSSSSPAPGAQNRLRYPAPSAI
ncbi:hypothetical protein HYPSUDRAFT_552324 [Hypholoma sublateritium FD-334 SS-4]|uniref:Uncharacterized protein n=1 Tax=Hypholoma sublateritium (strain FD-334 SS-4) TaxID=945553 RepID=A0A0D2LA24_HYPSF|nr:hypothetical protein HYPSUDRAFT_552324 [Hypholoma sublateritium FD-334 SS-4]